VSVGPDEFVEDTPVEADGDGEFMDVSEQDK